MPSIHQPPKGWLTIVELVHSGRLTKGRDTMAEAALRLGKRGKRAVVHGENGKWYCLAIANAKKYNRAVDYMNSRRTK